MTDNSTGQSDSETADYGHFKPGDKVRTIFGEVRTVWEQRGYVKIRGEQRIMIDHAETHCGL